MKAVIYARYSSDSQREESIEGQLRECTAFAEKNGITVLRHAAVFLDISDGSSGERDGAAAIRSDTPRVAFRHNTCDSTDVPQV